MFAEKLLLEHLKLNAEQTKQLFFESLMKSVWQLFAVSLQPLRCNRSNLVASVGSAEGRTDWGG